MNKLIILLTIIIVVAIVYVLMQPRRESPVVKIPDVIVQPTEAQKSDIDTSKIQTEDTVLGQGDEAVDGKRVSVQYRGTLEDGTEFDSSYKNNNTPLTFTVGSGEMIIGFDYGVRGMRVGGTRKITLPPEFAYGDQPQGTIPANSTLIFEVTLEKVE